MRGARQKHCQGAITAGKEPHHGWAKVTTLFRLTSSTVILETRWQFKCKSLSWFWLVSSFVGTGIMHQQDQIRACAPWPSCNRCSCNHKQLHLQITATARCSSSASLCVPKLSLFLTSYFISWWSLTKGTHATSSVIWWSYITVGSRQWHSALPKALRIFYRLPTALKLYIKETRKHNKSENHFSESKGETRVSLVVWFSEQLWDWVMLKICWTHWCGLLERKAQCVKLPLPWII